MKFLPVAALAVAAPLVSACGDNDHVQHRRQVPPVGTSSVPSGVSVPPGATATNVPTVSTVSTVSTLPVGATTTNVPVVPVTTTYSFSLDATNPTAVPLSEIISTATSAPTRALDSTPAAGSTPTFLPGAPALPDISQFSYTNYPAWDQIPSVDSPEVQQWKQDVANSGIPIPDFQPNILGGCAANAAAVADPNRCWWTCSGCTRESDITECPDKMHWGLTYDDGPGFYTSNLLQYLDEKNLKSTFFLVGSRISQFPAIAQAQYMGQHQIAIHTWSHRPLTTLTTDQVIAELGWSKKIMKDVLGVTPNMMRPPEGDIDDRVRAISLAMGLTPVMWTRLNPLQTFDTDDFYIKGGGSTVEQVLQSWGYITNNASNLDTGFIVLEHDLHQQSVQVATGYILPDALAHNPPFVIEPVIACINRPLSDAYIETNNNEENPPPTGSGAVDPIGITTTPTNIGSSNTGAIHVPVATGSGNSSSSNSNAASVLHIGNAGVVAVVTSLFAIITSLF